MIVFVKTFTIDGFFPRSQLLALWGAFELWKNCSCQKLFSNTNSSQPSFVSERTAYVTFLQSAVGSSIKIWVFVHNFLSI